MQDTRIYAIVNEKIVIKCRNFHTFGGGTSLVMALANRRTDRFACLEHFSSSIDKISFKKNSMSLGRVVLEKKLFTRTCPPTWQSDYLMSTDCHSQCTV